MYVPLYLWNKPTLLYTMPFVFIVRHYQWWWGTHTSHIPMHQIRQNGGGDPSSHWVMRHIGQHIIFAHASDWVMHHFGLHITLDHTSHWAKQCHVWPNVMRVTSHLCVILTVADILLFILVFPITHILIKFHTGQHRVLPDNNIICIQSIPEDLFSTPVNCKVVPQQWIVTQAWARNHTN